MGDSVSPHLQRLCAVPGVRSVVCFDAEALTVIEHINIHGGSRDAALQASALGSLVARAKLIVHDLFDGEALQHLSVRTKKQTEYLVAPDELCGSGAAIAVLQGPAPLAHLAPRHQSPIRRHQPPTTADWLFGAADE